MPSPSRLPSRLAGTIVTRLRAVKRRFSSNEGVPFEQLNGCQFVLFTTFSQASVG